MESVQNYTSICLTSTSYNFYFLAWNHMRNPKSNSRNQITQTAYHEITIKTLKTFSDNVLVSYQFLYRHNNYVMSNFARTSRYHFLISMNRICGTLSNVFAAWRNWTHYFVCYPNKHTSFMSTIIYYLPSMTHLSDILLHFLRTIYEARARQVSLNGARVCAWVHKIGLLF